MEMINPPRSIVLGCSRDNVGSHLSIIREIHTRRLDEKGVGTRDVVSADWIRQGPLLAEEIDGMDLEVHALAGSLSRSALGGLSVDAPPVPGIKLLGSLLLLEAEEDACVEVGGI
jgi:hypothetical protein